MTFQRGLPDVLDSTDLPEPELFAARLDGEVARLGPAFYPVDLPPNHSQRAQSLRPILPVRLIADRRTAAWVYGAIPVLPVRLEACARSDARASALLLSHSSVREVVIENHEILTYGDVRVTTPLRTIIDLVRATEFDAEVQSIVATLATDYELSLEQCIGELTPRKHLPMKREAIARLHTALGSPKATTRADA